METISESKRNLKRIVALPFFCLVGAVLNALTGNFFRDALGIPLFMNTIFTVAMTLYGGPVCGVFTGLLTNPAVNIFNLYGKANLLYAFCNAAAALGTFLFIRFYPAKLRFGAGKTVKTSVFGTVKDHSRPGPEPFFKLALLRKTLPPVIVEIPARIPLNTIDRLLSVLGGYAVAALLWPLLPRYRAAA